VESYLRVKDLSKWQHYKRRNPPWIKLYNTIFNDYRFSKLRDETKYHLIAIWSFASVMDNKLPNDSEWISTRIGANLTVDLTELTEAGFVEIVRNDPSQLSDNREKYQDASKVLAGCYQSATPETETETEKDKVKRSKSNGLKPSGNPDPKFVKFWENYGRKVKKREALKVWHYLSESERQEALTRVLSPQFQTWAKQQTRDGQCYLPHPTVWLRGHRWEDELETKHDEAKSYWQSLTGVSK